MARARRSDPAHVALISDTAELARIRQLAIPPPQQKAWICTDPKGHIQSGGLDSARRGHPARTGAAAAYPHKINGLDITAQRSSTATSSYVDFKLLDRNQAGEACGPSIGRWARTGPARAKIALR